MSKLTFVLVGCLSIGCSSSQDRETVVRYNPGDATLDESRLAMDALTPTDGATGGDADAEPDADVSGVPCFSYVSPPQTCGQGSLCEHFTLATEQIPTSCISTHQRCIVAAVGSEGEVLHGQVRYDKSKADFGDHSFVIDWPAGGNALYYRYYTQPTAEALLGAAPHAVIAITDSQGLNDDAAWFYADYSNASMSAAMVGDGRVISAGSARSTECGVLPRAPNGWVCFAGGAVLSEDKQSVQVHFSSNFGISHSTTVAAPVANLQKVGYAELRVPDPPTERFIANVDTFEVSSSPLPCPTAP